MDDVLRQALEPVLRDIESTGAPTPRIGDADWANEAAMLWSADGSGMGVTVTATDPEADRTAKAADQVQEWVIEELWGQAATNWPPCPNHPDSHPLSAEVRDDVAVWVCPRERTVFAAVGSLGHR